jgi:hypothetical protein
MTTNEKKVEFMRILAAFLGWCFQNDYEVIGSELYRTKEQAEIYAKSGKGILNSIHRMKMAIDLFRYKDGTVTWDFEDYREMGEKWKTLHPLARWGGDFNDAVHFSFEHEGRK